MHGALPHALILCYEVGRTVVTGFDSLAIPPLAQVQALNETMAGVYGPCPVIGISMNSRLVSEKESEAERQRIRDEFGLPVCDVVRHGCEELSEAIEAFQQRKDWSQAAGCE